jgi:pimeloyl-ACP methyl ester carboxylesterase
VGHSAGGHLVAWAAGRPGLSASSPWHRSDVGADAVVSLAGVVDLGLAHRLGLDDGATDELLGGGPDEVPDRYAATDPMLLTPHVPVVQVHGTDDDRVPIEIGRSYLSRGASGVRMVELSGIEHFGLIDPLSRAWPTVLGSVRGAGRDC